MVFKKEVIMAKRGRKKKPTLKNLIKGLSIKSRKKKGRKRKKTNKRANKKWIRL